MSGPNWPIFAILASLSMLLGAHAFEIIGKYAPCPLCLRQRDVYWAAAAMAVAGLVLWQRKPANRYLVALNIMLGLVFLTGAVVATYHAGVEWKFWAGPTECSGGGGAIDIGDLDLIRALEGPVATVSCVDAPWALFGVSMAGYNALVSYALVIASFMAARTTYKNARASMALHEESV
ncbi:MAG: disulfide bond formation protein B [Hyphomonadaceae bacterium]